MSQQSPFATQGVNSTSLFRKKRTIFALVAGIVTLFLFLRLSSNSSPNAVQVDELNGLLYMVSNTENVLPHSLNVAEPVAPSVWVPREPFNPKAWKERSERLDKNQPLIVFSKSYCPYSRRAKDLLARYNLKPAPHVVEVDLRDDGDAIKSLLIRLTDRYTFPNVILKGKSLGGFDNLQALHQNGNLEIELEKAGIRVTGDIHGDE